MNSHSPLSEKLWQFAHIPSDEGVVELVTIGTLTASNSWICLTAHFHFVFLNQNTPTYGLLAGAFRSGLNFLHHRFLSYGFPSYWAMLRQILFGLRNISYTWWTLVCSQMLILNVNTITFWARKSSLWELKLSNFNDRRQTFLHRASSVLSDSHSQGWSVSPWGCSGPTESVQSNYFHNNTKMWFAFFTALTQVTCMRKPWRVRLLLPRQESRPWHQPERAVTVFLTTCTNTKGKKMSLSLKNVLEEALQLLILLNFIFSRGSFCVI